MSPHTVTVPTLIIAFKVVTLLLGGLITYLAYQAYQRTGSRSLQLLSVGFGVVTLGVLLAGVVDQFLQYDFRVGQLVETVLITAGFAVIVYSLYATDT